MKNYINRISYFFVIIALVFASCAEDGEPGPQGEQGLQGEEGPQGDPGEGITIEELGTFSMELTGTRRDGSTPISISKMFTTATEKSGFVPKGDYHTLELSARDSIAYTSFRLVVFDKDETSASAKLEYVFFRNEEVLPNNQLLDVNFRTNDRTRIMNYRIALDNNDYAFINGATSYDWEYDEDENKSYLVFDLKDGSKVEYESAYESYNDIEGYYYGAFRKLIDKDGNVTTSGTIYENLELRWDGDYQAFFENGISLGEVVEIAPDALEVTNFDYDKAAGVVSFDYNITVRAGGDDFHNSTGNEITVNGSVAFEVYDEIVSRK